MFEARGGISRLEVTAVKIDGKTGERSEPKVVASARPGDKGFNKLLQLFKKKED